MTSDGSVWPWHPHYTWISQEHEWVNEWMNGRTDKQTDGWPDERRDAKGRKNERRNELTKGLTGLDGWTGRRTNELTYGRMNEWMKIIVLLFIQNNYSLKQGKNELLANRTSKNADVSRWLIEAVFTRIFWLFVCSVFQRYLSHLNSSFKLLLCGRRKNTVKALCDGEFYSQLSTTTQLHNIDIATRDQRMKNSGAFHWLDHPSYPIEYNSMRIYFNSSLTGELPN